jgi:hypothetical protein
MRVCFSLFLSSEYAKWSFQHFKNWQHFQ